MAYFLHAWRFLTAIPAPGPPPASDVALGPSLKYFSLVGLALGLAWAVSDWALRQVLPLPVASALLLAIQVGTTGGLHLEGLADTCDGLFSRASPERRLEIMRDSRTGAYGAMGVGLALIIKYSALVYLTPPLRFPMIVLLGVLSRWATGLAVQVFPYAREQGLGVAFKIGSGRTDAIISSAAALATALALLQLWGILAMLWAGLTMWLGARSIMSRLPGLTGDTYGAINEGVEIAVLLFLAALAGQM